MSADRRLIGARGGVMIKSILAILLLVLAFVFTIADLVWRCVVDIFIANSIFIGSNKEEE